MAIDVAACLSRSSDRVCERVPDDAPLKQEGELVCPFCRDPLTVRFSKLGRLDETPAGDRPHIDGVKLKCAGDGCGLRLDFDVPIPEDEWQAERDRRDGDVHIDAGYTPDAGRTVEERLADLGYLPAPRRG